LSLRTRQKNNPKARQQQDMEMATGNVHLKKPEAIYAGNEK